MKAIILVGGEGTRLKPLTLHRLKSMAPMAGRPFLEYQFALLRRHGVREAVLSICHLPDVIRAQFGTGKRYGLKLSYAVERKPLGTAGAIKNAQALIGTTDLLAVLNGDILSDFDLTAMARIHRQQKAVATIGLTWVEDPSDYGLVYTKSGGRVSKFVEKPSQDESENHWVNSGLYLFSPEVFEHIPARRAYSVERQLFPDLLARGARIGSCSRRYYWKDIGTPAKYHQANLDILEGRMFMLPVGETARRNARLRVGRACRINPSAELYAPAVLGDRCVVEEKARVGESVVLGDRVRVGRHAVIERSVIWDQVEIGESASLSGCVVGTGCRIGRFASLRPGTVLGEGAVVPDYSRA